MQSKNARPIFIKGRLPRNLHRQMKMLLAMHEETWEDWIQRKVQEDVANSIEHLGVSSKGGKDTDDSTRH